MTATVNVREAKTHFSRLIRRAMAGEQIVLARAGKPVAGPGPITERPAKRVLGQDVGKAWISPNFDDPLPEFEEYM